MMTLFSSSPASLSPLTIARTTGGLGVTGGNSALILMSTFSLGEKRERQAAVEEVLPVRAHIDSASICPATSPWGLSSTMTVGLRMTTTLLFAGTSMPCPVLKTFAAATAADPPIMLPRNVLREMVDGGVSSRGMDVWRWSGLWLSLILDPPGDGRPRTANGAAAADCRTTVSTPRGSGGPRVNR
jgi:hypothetical protein